jgi:hypothetical protein
VLPAIEYKNGIWILRTAIGNFGGDPLPGHDVKVQKFSSIDQAQSFVPFAIRQPTFLPAGYEFREVIVSPSDWVFLFYDGINGDLVIAQLPVGKVTVNEPSQQIDSMPVGPVTVGQLNTVGVGMLTEKQVRPVTINGQPAAWVEETGLMWETDGISFMIGGPGLTQEEITQTAESLK